jgi:hypothetical protein
MSDQKVLPPNNYENFTLEEAAFICGQWLSCFNVPKPKSEAKITAAVVSIYQNQRKLRNFHDHDAYDLKNYIGGLSHEYAKRIVDASKAQTKIA